MRLTALVMFALMIAAGCTKKSLPPADAPKVETPCPAGDLPVKETAEALSEESVVFVRKSLAGAAREDDRALVRAVEAGLARVSASEQAVFVSILSRVGLHQTTARAANRLLVRLSFEQDVLVRAGLLAKVTALSEKKTIQSNEFASIF